jgi:hypothetical protein
MGSPMNARLTDTARRRQGGRRGSSPLFAEPVADGNDLVFELEDTFVEDVPEPGCERRVTYRAQWFVDAECLADYGLRDLVITSDAICCEGEGEDPAVECTG